MPLVVTESARSGPVIVNWNQARVTRLYNVMGAENEAAAISAVHGSSPLFWLGLRKNEVSADPQGGGFWTGKVEYVNPQGGELAGQTGNPGGGPGGAPVPPQYEDDTKLGNEFSATTGSGTTHITQSLATMSAIPNGTAPDYKQAIGVSKDGVAGCDRHSGTPEFTITKRVEFITMKYWRGLCKCANEAPMNQARWNTFEEHELLFLGADARYAGDSQADMSWIVTYKFAFSQTLRNIPITPTLIVPVKHGWDYLWVRYSDAVDAVAGVTVKRADAAYVERIYKDTSFVDVLGF